MSKNQDERYWSELRCPICGLRYKDFRAEDQPSFSQMRAVLREQRDERIERDNDYSRPPRRARVLGKMHQYKAGLWKHHVEACEHQAELDDPDYCPF